MQGDDKHPAGTESHHHVAARDCPRANRASSSLGKAPSKNLRRPRRDYVFALNSTTRILNAGWEYLSFMAVVGGFFVVAGGIHLHVGGPGLPALNTLFLLAGALLGNVIGTVGASMLLIRPWIAINRNRFAGLHVAFFIFAVSNIGGVLLPIGPPLLLGYLKGVPFWWTAQRCWQPWCVTLGAVLIIFYFLDRLNCRAVAQNQRCGSSLEWRELALRWRAQFHFHGGNARHAHRGAGRMARGNYFRHRHHGLSRDAAGNSAHQRI